MKKIISIFLILISISNFAQTRGVRIGYIDMEYILEKAPEYAEASNQLEQKAQKWKLEIEAKKNEILKLKEELNTEKVLLTKELIEEREEEIAFFETELLEYQEKRFGAKGDLIIQKTVLVKPIQDQIFTAIQDIAEARKYDFIFDKSSDLTMLFAAQRFDISDQVIRALSRSQKREQLSKKDLKEQEEEEAREDMIDENPELAAREKILQEKREAREKLIEDKRKAIEERKRIAAERRQKLIDEKEEKKNGTVIENKEENKDKTETTVEDKRKALEERKKKILENRAAEKKKREEESKTKKE
uniref:OmpH family outer membrane protein n=1 Tax=Flavobacterium sp. TaxID=239 RepID=UPI004049291E